MTTMSTSGSPNPPDDTESKDFTAWATSPLAWFSHAEQLHQSSELLWQPIDRLFDLSGPTSPKPIADVSGMHAPAYLLIAGFAIEAKLKAAAIQTELNEGGIDRLIVPGPSPLLRGWVKTHKLAALAARARVSYDGDELIYLRRFEKYIIWAGRYPVPLAPPSASEPRGFDHRVGLQDRRVFQEILKHARGAYLRARSAEGAWSEPTSVGPYREREAIWMATCTQWLRIVRQALVNHALRVCNGERGVLQINVDTSEMQAQVSAPTSLVRLEPAWFPADEFLSLFGSTDGVGPETARRWAEGLTRMDPSTDVVLFLYNTPDADGRWFSRYIFLREGEIEPEQPRRWGCWGDAEAPVAGHRWVV